MDTGITQDSTQNKLILLFVFDKMETALTESTVIDLCSYKNNWIDYTNCKQALYEVVQNGFVYKSVPSGGGEELYDLTAEGRWCLKNFYTRIPGSVRQLISDDIKKKRIVYRRKQDYVATYEKCQDGTYDVILKIVEPTKTTLEVNKTYTVKKGDTLWAIASKYYGSGAQYTKIYKANTDKISNPNLIYPGQVFTIP